ncbi:DUF4375 domain-containing protein [Cnuibacter sp. UC19_7]|uniref:DMP19 family protein n=1 Tax=Cnuibacter sp. UC19_7 TaxID=3350166 RepID=UPI00366E93EA
MGRVGPAITDVQFEGERILLRLRDGRTLSAPLSWAGPEVASMDDAARARWVCTDDGTGVNWPAVGHSSSEGVISAWALEEDALYEGALNDLRAAHRDVSLLTERSRLLVALWRLVADGCNGGLMQFLGNWGPDEVQVAIEALSVVGAVRTLAVVRAFWDAVAPLAESEAVNTWDGVWEAVENAGLSAHLDDLDAEFWEAAPELTRRVPLYFGPAPSAQ